MSNDVSNGGNGVPSGGEHSSDSADDQDYSLRVESRHARLHRDTYHGDGSYLGYLPRRAAGRAGGAPSALSRRCE
jgi:hypothetical protein